MGIDWGRMRSMDKEPKGGDSREIKSRDNVVKLKGEKPKALVTQNHAMTPPSAESKVKL